MIDLPPGVGVGGTEKKRTNKFMARHNVKVAGDTCT